MLFLICSKSEHILFYNWTTPYRTVSIFTTCWRKFSHSRFAKFCSVLKSIRGDGSLGLGNLLMKSLSVNIGMCRESQISSENSNFGLYHPYNPSWYPFQEMILRNHQALYISKKQESSKLHKQQTNKPMQSPEIAPNFYPDQELNWYERFWERNRKLTLFRNVLTLSTKLQNKSFRVVDITRTAKKCTKMKYAHAKR